ncbi:MAG: hypothetical protein ACYC2H_11225 [Thermoplasmatota archaeon]
MDPAAVAAYYRGKGYVVRDGARVAGPSGQEHKVPLLAEGPLGSLAVFFGDFGGVDGPEMGGARKVAREIGATPVLAADEFSNADRQLAAKLGVVLIDAATLSGEGTPTPPGLGADTGRAWPGLAPLPTRRARQDEPEPHPWPASGRLGGRDGPATGAVDVEEMLGRPVEATPPGQDESLLQSAPLATSAGPAPESSDGDGLWKRPRSREAASSKRAPRESGAERFAWLGADAAPAASGPSAPAAAGALAVEYDDVVPAKRGVSTPTARRPSDTPAAPDERLGEAVELQPTMEELEHRARRDRMLRRVFWLLFVIAVASLLAYFGRP